MKKRPIIGITCNISYDDKQPMTEGIGVAQQSWQLLATDYIFAIKRAGGIPVILPLLDDEETIKELLQSMDGILMSGGTDIDPKYSNELPINKIKIDPFRDKCDLFMMRHILNETKLPVLGVCRGIQILNVALGGTIYQDIDSSKFNNHINLMYSKCDWSHHVTVKKNSRLHHAVQNDVIGVNSFHHQAIHKLGSNLDVVAVAEDGIVEAVEYNDASRFVLAVQWHPEMMGETTTEQQQIINCFVQSCRTDL